MPYADPVVRREYHRRYLRDHYQRRKPEYLTRNRDRRQLFRQIVRAAKAGGCKECGAHPPLRLLGFYHRPGTVATFPLNGGRFVPSAVALRTEIEKCEVLCRRCGQLYLMATNQWEGIRVVSQVIVKVEVSVQDDAQDTAALGMAVADLQREGWALDKFDVREPKNGSAPLMFARLTRTWRLEMKHKIREAGRGASSDNGSAPAGTETASAGTKAARDRGRRKG